MSTSNPSPNRRVLIVDDSPAIHEDFRKILAGEAASGASSARAAFLGRAASKTGGAPSFELDSALQGAEALEKLQRSIEEGRPYAMAFVDVRMPPGWDGIETIEHLWQASPELHTVICTAYSDYSWEETFQRLGRSDRLLILKKPFDPIEISQLATALTEKWNVERRVASLIDDLRKKEQEARSYASSLETVNRALETSKRAAEKSSEMKTDFLVHLSREIRDKVSDVVGEVAQVRTPTDDAERALERLDAVIHSSSYLLATLDEVSDIALIDSGRLELERRSFAPALPLERVLDDLRPLAEAKGLALTLERRGVLPGAVVGDPERIAQVLRSLVSNAIRYTERGGVRCTLIAGAPRSPRETHLRYAVEDTGVGIPRERMGRLFEPFACARENGAGTVGAGLGLAHSQRLARHLGGDLAVESEPGRGSRFTLTLDLGVHA